MQAVYHWQAQGILIQGYQMVSSVLSFSYFGPRHQTLDVGTWPRTVFEMTQTWMALRR